MSGFATAVLISYNPLGLPLLIKLWCGSEYYFRLLDWVWSYVDGYESLPGIINYQATESWFIGP